MAIQMYRTERSTYFKTTLTSYVRKQHEMYCILHCVVLEKNRQNIEMETTAIRLVLWCRWSRKRMLLCFFFAWFHRKNNETEIVGLWECDRFVVLCAACWKERIAKLPAKYTYYWDVEKLSLVPTQESVWVANHFSRSVFFCLGVSFIFFYRTSFFFACQPFIAWILCFVFNAH